MNFLKKLSQIFPAAKQEDSNDYWIEVKCNRCGEILKGRVHLYNDLSIEFNGDKSATYFCRKILVGDGKNLCFQQIEVSLWFDVKRNLINREVQGGKFVDEIDDEDETK
jgi:hypothetical protein